MDKKVKILTFISVSLFFLLFIFSVLFTQWKFQILNEKIESLEKIISQKNNWQLSWDDGDGWAIRLWQDRDMFNVVEQEIGNLFNKKGNWKLEDLFPVESNTNLDKTSNLDIKQTVQFSNKTVINWVVFSYTFSVSDWELKGIVTSNNETKLQELKESLKKLRVSIISSDDKQFEFETDREMTIKVLQLFNIKMK